MFSCGLILIQVFVGINFVRHIILLLPTRHYRFIGNIILFFEYKLWQYWPYWHSNFYFKIFYIRNTFCVYIIKYSMHPKPKHRLITRLKVWAVGACWNMVTKLKSDKRFDLFRITIKSGYPFSLWGLICTISCFENNPTLVCINIL